MRVAYVDIHHAASCARTLLVGGQRNGYPDGYSRGAGDPLSETRRLVVALVRR